MTPRLLLDSAQAKSRNCDKRTGCGKSPWTKIKSKFTRSLNGYS